MDYLIHLNGRVLPESVGNKALQLRRLARIGMRIPETYVIPWEAYQRYLADDVPVVEELRAALAGCLKPDVAYAVRSSADIEDGAERSFAGQFKSVLNVYGADGVLQAVWAVWGTASSPGVRAYQVKTALAERALRMAVIVQEMVPPAWAGVALSRNPVTGADEVVVEAVPGSGEALVQNGVTPRRWIHKWGAYVQQPEDGSAPPGLVDRVVAETRLIAQKLKSHMDLEWVYDGAQLYWLQAREITALHHSNVYSNHISKEVVPGIIKPLIGSINIPLVCSMWIRLVSEMVGRTAVKPDDLAKSFYYRVYFNMGTLGQIFQEVGMPADSVETLMGIAPPGASKPRLKPTPKTFLRLPNLLLFLADKWFFAPKMRRALRRIQRDFEMVDYRRAGQLEPEQLLGEIDRLYALVQGAAYYNIVAPLLMMMYNRMLDGQLKRTGVNPARFDLMEGVEALHDYDPNYHLNLLHEQFTRLPPSLQAKVRSGDYITLLRTPGLQDFQRQVAAFLERFGQFSDSGNDFSATPWRETPGLVLELIANYTPPAAGQDAKLRFSDLRLRGLQRLVLGLFYHRARAFRLFREQISASYTYGYGLFRYFYLALGIHLTRQGLLDVPEDIFYLDDSQVRLLVTVGEAGPNARRIIAKHKQDIQRFEHMALPPVIYGDETPPVEDPSQERLCGVPTSIGHYTGKVTVVCGIKDIHKVQTGDVLVIPYSDVGWTPLFARAGAVVAESGGMLSHSSIVAREYNIPAVVSVAGATRLQDGTIVTVNGHNGQVLIHDGHTDL